MRTDWFKNQHRNMFPFALIVDKTLLAGPNLSFTYSATEV